MDLRGSFELFTSLGKQVKGIELLDHKTRTAKRTLKSNLEHRILSFCANKPILNFMSGETQSYAWRNDGGDSCSKPTSLAYATETTSLIFEARMNRTYHTGKAKDRSRTSSNAMARIIVGVLMVKTLKQSYPFHVPFIHYARLLLRNLKTQLK